MPRYRLQCLPCLAQRQDGRCKKNPARYLNQIAQGKQHNEYQQACGFVGQYLLLQEFKAEVSPQAGYFNRCQQQADKRDDGEQAAIGPNRGDITQKRFPGGRRVFANGVVHGHYRVGTG